MSETTRSIAPQRSSTPRPLPDHVRVAVIGAGFGGLGAAIRLRQEGHDDFVVLEKGDDVGGTWWWNTYPGAQCDIPSVLYSFSFAPKPDWSRLYPLQEELQSYLHECVERFGVGDHLHLRTEMLDAAWDENSQVWRIETSRGSLTASVLVAATGPFSEASIPDLPGIDTFQGEAFHSMHWRHDLDLEGKRIGVIGTGASAVQFIPQLQPLADRLTVFQRTATWILPHPDRPVPPRAQRLFARWGAPQRAMRLGWELVQEAMVPGFVWWPPLQKGLELTARWHLRRQVADRDLRAQLRPGYAVGCKRPTFSNSYYPALASENVTVTGSGIDRVTTHGIVTADGTLHELDVIVYGTGFRITGNSGFARLRGRDGRTLAEHWAGGEPRTDLGTAVTGFPNMLMLLGPNSVTYTSQVVTIEAQVEYLLETLRVLDQHDLASLEVTTSAQASFVEWISRGLARSVWNTGGCASYYLSPTGFNFTFWPGFARGFKRRMQRVELADHAVVEARAVPGALSPTATRATVERLAHR
ncbi:4-hydroxyacetophenone monooxygenase [Knoellia sinensis KCTC 19936]|uniref:4-hydroxyacetophenone monooxygenase n=1 Tax=Knoellia sinensis KCTC 19936 TaxID=1385520 RepID=A0A0A0J5S5_9MICO|nr:NAD(P)/FAD-dependent oxidoreductase [Knoellia sinensis]KGN32114.1 4-hydroxyacetophenone monooxygenase [Knoellia sinensis KCTC 19936]